MAEVTIDVIKNGPYIIKGPVELKDSNGNSYPTEARMALCRCGASTEKPFCDGSHLKEFRAVGIIEASPDVVFAVLNDGESYTQFMPYTAEVRVLSREKNSAVMYQRLKLPLISDRDYTIVAKHESDGATHRLH